MPKKLRQLLNDVDAVTKDYDDQISQITMTTITASNHRGMIEEGEGELAHRLKELQSKGKKGSTVGDFYDDKAAKAFIDEIENQKSRFRKACEQYWVTRDNLDKTTKAADSLVASAATIIADKQRKWFGSNSLQMIQTMKSELEGWCKDTKASLTNLAKLPKPARLAWAAAGSTKKLKPTEVLDKQDLHTMGALLTFIQQRAQADKGRTATLQKIHSRLVKLSAQDLDG
ncbi:MAG: hypothetical protein NW701_14010 [Nitrospira sp.]